MAEHREQVDKRMMRQINRRVITPLLIDLGARYLVKPYMGKYDDEEKTANWGFGHKKHGDKRHRTTVTYLGINYIDGDTTDGKTYQRVEDSYSAWSVKHDNRLVQNDETITKKVVVLRGDLQPDRDLHLVGPYAAVLRNSARRDRWHRWLRHQHH